MKKFIALVFCSALVMSFNAPSPARAEDAFAKKILQLHPEADTNGDGVLSSAEEAVQLRTILTEFPKLDRDGDSVLSDAEKQTLIRFVAAKEKRKPGSSRPSPAIPTTDKWKTIGFKQANTMGAGEAAIPSGGKLRVFVLMGQSNMHGTARANELKPPYNEKHNRIRVWANGRWEYFVPSQRFGPGVSFAHQLAAFWPQDTIGIIKVSSGGTGIRGFEKNWSSERASLTFDEKKGSLYKDLMNAVAEATRVSKPEICGFIWKQGAADGTKKVLANEYYHTFRQLVTDLRTDLETPELPVFVPSYMNDEDLLRAIMSNLGEEDLQKVQHPAGETLEKNGELLESALAYLNDASFSKRKENGGKRPYMAAVIAAQNQAGRDIPNVTTIYPGQLPKGADGIHFSAEGYIKLGKFTASAVEEFYKGHDFAMQSVPR